MNGDFPPPEQKPKAAHIPPPPQPDVEIIQPTHPGGRPNYQPTEAERNMVTILAGIKFSHKKIAAVLKISDNTLRKYFSTELETGEAQLYANVVGKLMDKINKGDTRAILYFLEKMGVLDAEIEKKPDTLPNIKITVVDHRKKANGEPPATPKPE